MVYLIPCFGGLGWCGVALCRLDAMGGELCYMGTATKWKVVEQNAWVYSMLDRGTSEQG